MVTEKPFIRGSLIVDFQSREVAVGGKPMKLNPSEYDLLHLLVTNEGLVVSKQMLLEKIWGPEHMALPEYVGVYIKT